VTNNANDARAARWLFFAISAAVGFAAGAGVWAESSLSQSLALLAGFATGIVVTAVVFLALALGKTL